MKLLSQASLLIVFMFSFFHQTSAQIEYDWIRMQSIGDNERANTAIIAPNGNIYVGGYYYSGSTQLGYIQKYNSAGDAVAWSNQFPAEYKSMKLKGNRIWSTGKIKDGTDYDIYTVRNDTANQPLNYCTAQYNSSGTQNDEGLFVMIGSDTSAYVAGNTRTTTWVDYRILKYGTNCAQSAVNSYSRGSGDSLTAMTMDGSDNVYVTGRSDGGGGASWDYTTIKYNSSLTQQWAAHYAGSGGVDEPHAITVDNSGNVYVTGMSYDATQNYNIVTVKYNSSGVQQYAKT